MALDWYSKLAAVALGVTVLSPATSDKAAARTDPFIGEMMIFAGNFCPTGWAKADGQYLQISQNQTLFSIIWTIYGGDGRTTLRLPDMRGRSALHAGTGPGLSPVQLGQSSGSESHTLSINQLPSHSHTVMATNSFADKPGPGGKYLAGNDQGLNSYHYGPPNKVMGS